MEYYVTTARQRPNSIAITTTLTLDTDAAELVASALEIVNPDDEDDELSARDLALTIRLEIASKAREIIEGGR